MQYFTENFIVKEIHDKIDHELSRIGLLYRVFSRGKSENSLKMKYDRNPNKYTEDGKKIQDLIGIRVTTYFPDDIEIAINAIKKLFEYDSDSSTIDCHQSSTFSAIRCNLVFKLPDDLIDQSDILRKYNWIDKTFEVQFRTVLSEGWHEVDHDLRYKCKEDWSDHDDLERALNGIFASLETSDWGMMKIFDELSHRHYKKKEWAQMLRTKLRLRAGNGLSDGVIDLLNSDYNLCKTIFRIKRAELLKSFIKYRIIMPITLDNILFFANYVQLNEPRIEALTPLPILLQLKTINLAT